MDFAGKKVLIVGLARSGMAAIKVLHTLGAEIVLSEAKKKSDIKELPILEELGVTVVDQSLEVANGTYDLVVKNPGVHNDTPFMVKLYENGNTVITEIELAFQVAKPQHFIAITGTNGKTTTSTLCHEILHAKFGDKAHLCGNIGIPLCEIVMNENLLNEEGHYITLEISNYQLVNIDKFHPDVATIINLTPDHIDVHGTLDAYYKSKTEVYRNMDKADTFILNADDATVKEYTDKYPIPATVKTFSLDETTTDNFVKDGYVVVGGEKVLPVDAIRIPGKHNLQNVMIAVSIAKVIGIDNEIIENAVRSFIGVEHRIEFVREINGVKYYNDSKGTNTDATVTALKAFDHGVILLVGGFEKGLPMDDVKAQLGPVKKVIGFGACGKRLVHDLVGDDGIVVETLPEALAEANKIAEDGDTVLLSPTTSSFDQYTCFEERGEHFKKLVNELPPPFIGVFDSGIGGLTVVKSIVESMPNENILYFGDTAHVPYGTKSPRQVTEFVLKDVEFLNKFNIKAIVIACNTADSIARKKVEQLYDLPIFGVVDPASKRAAEVTKNGKIGVIATSATVKSRAYDAAITQYKKDAEVYSAACPLLVPLVENGRFQKGDKVTEEVLREYLEPLVQKGIDTLVLGCTHYPLLSVIIENLYPNLQVISSSDAAAATLKESLKEKNLISNNKKSERKYFVSDDAEGFSRQAKIFMGDALGGEVKLVNIE